MALTVAVLFVPAVSGARYRPEAPPPGRVAAELPIAAVGFAPETTPPDLVARVEPVGSGAPAVDGRAGTNPPSPRTTTAGPGSAAQRAIDYALAQLGLPYIWGGDGPAAGDAGFDCSGLVNAAYASAGISLPRTAQTLYYHGPLVAGNAALQPGDLVFYGVPSRVHHVGLYLGAGRMVNAPTFGKPVRVASYRWSGDDYLGATRPAAGRGAGPSLSAAASLRPTPTLRPTAAPRTTPPSASAQPPRSSDPSARDTPAPRTTIPTAATPKPTRPERSTTPARPPAPSPTANAGQPGTKGAVPTLLTVAGRRALALVPTGLGRSGLPNTPGGGAGVWTHAASGGAVTTAVAIRPGTWGGSPTGATLTLQYSDGTTRRLVVRSRTTATASEAARILAGAAGQVILLIPDPDSGDIAVLRAS